MTTNVQKLINSFVNDLAATITSDIMSKLNGTYGKPSIGVLPQVRKARKPLTKTRLAQMKMQGRFMGLLRGLSKNDQKTVKEENAKNGIVSAISLASRIKTKKEKAVVNGHSNKPAAKKAVKQATEKK